MSNLQDRIKRVEAWLTDSTATEIDPRDARIIAAMHIRRLDVAQRLALNDPSAVTASWADLAAAIQGEGDRKESSPTSEHLTGSMPQVLEDARPRHSRRERKAADPKPSEPERDATTVGEPEASSHVPTVPEVIGVAGDPHQVDLGGFAAFKWEDFPDLSSAHQLDFTMHEHAPLISWPAASTGPGQVAVYRLVASGEAEPAMPDSNVILATTGTSVVDPNGTNDPFQHVQVWVNVGSDIPAAKASQPKLHARGLLVRPPASFDVEASEGRVVGRWFVPSSDITVDVMWVDAHLADRVQGFDVSRRIPSIHGGFTHLGAPAGRRIEYRVVARIERQGGDGNLIQGVSPVISQTVETPAVIQPVTDLRITPSELDSSLIDLSWTAPEVGTVDIYMVGVEPPTGLERQEILDRTALDTIGLTRPEITPTSIEDGRTWMRSVEWNRKWARAWLIPVTKIDENQMKAGPTVVQSRPPEPVTGLRFIERVEAKLLSFEWPEAVDLVRVYVGAEGLPLNPEAETPVAELTAEDYRRFGGVQMDAAQLRVESAAIHVVSTSYSNNTPMFSAPTTVRYPGLRELRYDIEPPQRKRGRLGSLVDAGDQAVHSVSIWANSLWNHPARFQLVHHKEFLPLTPELGSVAYEWEWTPTNEKPFVGQFDLTPGIPGFVRLFVQLPDELQQTLAVHDPAIERLTLK